MGNEFHYIKEDLAIVLYFVAPSTMLSTKSRPFNLYFSQKLFKKATKIFVN